MACAGPHTPPDGVASVPFGATLLHVVVYLAEVGDELDRGCGRDGGVHVAACGFGRQQAEHAVSALSNGVLCGPALPFSPTHMVGHHAVQGHVTGVDDIPQLGIDPGTEVG